MIRIEGDTRRPKEQTLTRVAQLAFEGNLNHESMENIPFEIIPGTKPQFRCCVYREREIIHQRVRLAIGKHPNGKGESTGIINVIPAACEGCPIQRFSVTENCQKCLAKKCQEACPFGAISMTGKGAYIDPEKCRECGRCAQACPYNAIADLVRPCKRACPVGALTVTGDKIADIDESKCISCGACQASCPFGAISDLSFMTQVIDKIRSDTPTVAIIAPSLEGQFGPKSSMGRIKSACVAIGFTDCFDVSLGADATAQHEAHELLEAVEQGKKLTTSCCPAFVNLIRQHFPRLVENISHTASPQVITARWAREKYPGACVVFVGPCVAKKTEKVEGGADLVLTSEELLAMFEAKGVDVELMEEREQDGSSFGKGFAAAGGVTASVLRVLEEEGRSLPEGLSCHRCDGAAECKKALAMMAAGKFPANFLEGMACVGGCEGGPTNLMPTRAYKLARSKLVAQADGRGINENVAAQGIDAVRQTR